MSPAPFLDASALWRPRRPVMVSSDDALPGRAERPFTVRADHAVLAGPLDGPWPDGSEVLYVAMGCFWGAERLYWRTDGVVSTACGYLGGYTPHPTYDEVCTGATGHAEAVRVVYDPARVTPAELCAVFFENHDPTTPDRQGNDVGTQYRSAMFYRSEDERHRFAAAIEDAQELYAEPIVTTLEPLGEFHVAEDIHQDFYQRNRFNGYCMFIVDPKLAAARRAYAEWMQ